MWSFFKLKIIKAIHIESTEHSPDFTSKWYIYTMYRTKFSIRTKQWKE